MHNFRGPSHDFFSAAESSDHLLKLSLLSSWLTSASLLKIWVLGFMHEILAKVDLLCPKQAKEARNITTILYDVMYANLVFEEEEQRKGSI
jgi:hypothetical protein